MDEGFEVVQITDVVEIGLHPPRAFSMRCKTAPDDGEIVLGMDQNDVGPFVMALIRAATLAAQHLGHAPNPGMLPLRDVEVTAETSTKQVALVLHYDGFRLPLLLPPEKARAAAESLLRHAAMMEPPAALN